LSPKSIAFNVWKETPIPIYQKFYMFNWTNSEEIANKSSKPRFTEHGPYVFRYIHNITFLYSKFEECCRK
jgi:scavenger receptor class B, member 1